VQSTNGTDRAKQAGIEAAKAKGIYKGRKPSVPVERVREMRAAGRVRAPSRRLSGSAA